MSESRPRYGAGAAAGINVIHDIARPAAAGINVIHDIARPAAAGRVQVYGTDAWYEFRLLDTAGRVEYDSATLGEYGMGYGDPAIALRDALIHDTD